MLVLDRFEGDFAVIETTNGMVSIPKAELPEDAIEGSILRIAVDDDETAARRMRIEKLADDLFC